MTPINDADKAGGCMGKALQPEPVGVAEPCATHAGQALRTIEGESKAREYIARLQAEQADPDELALIVSMLYGAALRGFCRVVEKALGVQHV